MTRLLDVDLERPGSIQPSDEPVWIIVRAGDEVLGHAARPRIRRDELELVHLALLRQFAERLYARTRITASGVVSRTNASDVSVVVCTRDRPDFLEGWLESASRLDPAPGEIVVVDNASATDATKALAERFGVRYVLEPAPGLDHARNRAWRETGTAIVAYVDDDAMMEPGYAAGVAGGFLAPNVAAVTGLVLPQELDAYAQLVLERDVGGFRQAGYARRLFHARSAPVGLETWRMGAGANMAFRRVVLDALGGFDPRLDVGTRTRGGGDLDMFFRVLEAGHVVVFEPAAVVHHIHRRDVAGLIKQMTDWGIAFSAYLAKREIESPAIGRAARRHLRQHRFDLFARKPIEAVRLRRPLHLRMALAQGWGTLKGRAALLRETVAAASRPSD